MAPRYDVYSRSADERCRFALGRNGANTLFVIGLNPSIATRHQSDTTIAKVEEVGRRCDFDGFVMLNLCPVRATHIDALPRDADATRMKRNFAVIEAAVSTRSAPVLWAAWGASIVSRTFFVSAMTELVERLQRYEPLWRHYGPLTIDGHPRHPSRLDYAWRFSAFDADAYAERMSAKLAAGVRR